jgi:hypothetical protein
MLTDRLLGRREVLGLVRHLGRCGLAGGPHFGVGSRHGRRHPRRFGKRRGGGPYVVAGAPGFEPIGSHRDGAPLSWRSVAVHLFEPVGLHGDGAARRGPFSRPTSKRETGRLSPRLRRRSVGGHRAMIRDVVRRFSRVGRVFYLSGGLWTRKTRSMACMSDGKGASQRTLRSVTGCAKPSSAACSISRGAGGTRMGPLRP